MRRVLILGSTGSIGTQALDVLTPNVEVVGLAAASNEQLIAQQAAAHPTVSHVLVADPHARARLRADAPELTQVDDVSQLIDATGPDMVLNAIVGFAGLAATLAALDRGIDVALANKESLVAAGAFCTARSASTGARIIPVDSEHSALQQCIGTSPRNEIESLVLTASGGPFRGRTREDLRDVSREAALAHPTWSMGGKITIDSATLMNKGLELIEAMVLFDLPEHRIETIVHPHSIVHALVRHYDGSLIAHLGWPDMRVPISWALNWPARPPVDSARRLDLADMPALAFEAPDLTTFRCLALARDAARHGGCAPCVLNAANEVAVDAFLCGRIAFLDIADVVEHTLSRCATHTPIDSLAAAQDCDENARIAANQLLASDKLRG